MTDETFVIRAMATVWEVGNWIGVGISWAIYKAISLWAAR